MFDSLRELLDIVVLLASMGTQKKQDAIPRHKGPFEINQVDSEFPVVCTTGAPSG